MKQKYIVKELLRRSSKKLQEAQILRASREAQLLLMAYLKRDELWLLTNQKSEIEVDTLFFEWIERRCNNEPFEYIVNRVSFYSEEFYIDSGALIPRPETELLVDEVLKNIGNKEREMTIVEIGVGSGIVSVLLAKKLPNAKIIAVDISKKALSVAKKNIEKFNLQNRIVLREGSLLDSVKEKIDYLVSNPPYIAEGEALEKNLSYEPQNALFGGKEGDELIKKILDTVLERKIPFFSCEIGYDQREKIVSYLEDKQDIALSFYKDYSFFDRGFTLTRIMH